MANRFGGADYQQPLRRRRLPGRHGRPRPHLHPAPHRLPHLPEKLRARQRPHRPQRLDAPPHPSPPSASPALNPEPAHKSVKDDYAALYIFARLKRHPRERGEVGSGYALSDRYVSCRGNVQTGRGQAGCVSVREGVEGGEECQRVCVGRGGTLGARTYSEAE